MGTVMRGLRFVLAIALCGLLAGPRSRALTPIYPETLSIRSTPVLLDARDPARIRVGALTLIAGWQLESPSPQFGGWSAMHVEGDRFTVIGDAGSILRFRLGRFGHATDARIDALPGGCGPTSDKRYRDSESLTGDLRGWWIGYESEHRICRLTGDLARAIAVRAPPEMRRWPESGGAEAMLRLSDGRFLVFAERASRGQRDRSLLLFGGDPTDPAIAPTMLRYRPPAGFAPTDATELPDGRILVVNRRFWLDTAFTAALTVLDPAGLTTSNIVEGTIIARFEPPILHDNFEAVAVTNERGRTIVWLMSDDNSMSWQRSYLLKFALDPNAGRKPMPKPVRPLGRPSVSSRSSASTAGP